MRHPLRYGLTTQQRTAPTPQQTATPLQSFTDPRCYCGKSMMDPNGPALMHHSAHAPTSPPFSTWSNLPESAGGAF